MSELEKVHQWLDEHYDEMEKDLLAFLSINSEKGEKKEGMPFGEGPDQALKLILSLAEKQGFKTTNMDGYMGIIDYGEGASGTTDKIGIISHADVVPAIPEDWTTLPYSPAIRDGMIYARGVVDDKGPLIASQYALMALKECGVPLKKPVCHLIGTNEETGMGCIKYYKENCKYIPNCGFAPDGFFPVVTGEKGILRWTCSKEWADTPPGECTGDIYLQEFTGGTEINMIPAIAKARLLVTEQGYMFLKNALEAMPETLKKNVVIGDANASEFKTKEPVSLCQVDITATGFAFHASEPHKGENALSKILQLLSKVKLRPEGAGEFIITAARLLEDDTEGRNLGVYARDEYTSTTNAPALIKVGAGKGSFSCDTRYPVSHDEKTYVDLLQKTANENDLVFDLWWTLESLYYTKDAYISKTLSQVYEEYTGETGEPVITGNGTYARKLPGFIAFGPTRPGCAYQAHQVDEHLSQKDFLDIAHMYATAIYRLANHI